MKVIETVNYSTSEITLEEAYDLGWDLAADYPNLLVDVLVTVEGNEYKIEVIEK